MVGDEVRVSFYVSEKRDSFLPVPVAWFSGRLERADELRQAGGRGDRGEGFFVGVGAGAIFLDAERFEFARWTTDGSELRFVMGAPSSGSSRLPSPDQPRACPGFAAEHLAD